MAIGAVLAFLGLMLYILPAVVAACFGRRNAGWAMAARHLARREEGPTA